MREASRKHYKWLTDDSVTRLPLWTLRGRGWLVLYRLRPAGVGALLLVRHAASPVCPYDELQHVGRVDLGDHVQRRAVLDLRAAQPPGGHGEALGQAPPEATHVVAAVAPTPARAVVPPAARVPAIVPAPHGLPLPDGQAAGPLEWIGALSERRVILGPRPGRGLQGLDQILGPVTQNLEEVDDLAREVVQVFVAHGVLLEVDPTAAEVGLDVGRVLWQVRENPGRQTPLCSAVREDRTDAHRLALARSSSTRRRR